MSLASADLLLDEVGDLRDLLGHGDPRVVESLDLLRGRVGLALDDRAGVAEAHARHLVHEAAGHEGHDRQLRVVLADVTSQLGLHAAARLVVDDDRLGLLVLLEERHQLRVGGADDRVAADRAGRGHAEARRRQGGRDLGGHAAGARHDAYAAGLVRLLGVLGGTADAAHLRHARADDAEAVRADDARAAQVGELDHLRDVVARDALGHDHDDLHACLDRLEDGVAGEGGRNRHDGAVGHVAELLAELLHGVVHGHAVHLAAAPAGGDAADDLGAVVEALAGQVDGLTPGDALHDEGGALVDQHQGASVTSPEVRSSSPGALATSGPEPLPPAPPIFSTARLAAPCSDTERSKYSTPYFSRILKPSSSQAPGMRKTAIFSAGS